MKTEIQTEIRGALRVVAVAFLIGCCTSAEAALGDRLPPEAYLDAVDRQIARTGEGVPGRPFPCSRETTEGGYKFIETIPTDQCVRMLPPQRLRGLWRNEFEGSRFCPAPAQECSFDTPGDRIWLNFAADLPEVRIHPVGGLYEIEFTGRRTVYKGPYGHLGVSDHEVIVDGVVAMRMVEPPPPPPTEAEMDAAWKKCEAAGNCISIERLDELQKD